MRTVVVGASGQLGADLLKLLSGGEVVGLSHSDLDIRDLGRVRTILSGLKPDRVINTAAFNRVDDAEDQPEKAFVVNAYGARNLARVCGDRECVLMHVSTDYVFGGEKTTPYTEADAPNPLSVYGTAKLAGEYFVRNLCRKHFIVRTSGLYGSAGSRGKGGNFVETMIRMAGEGKPIRVVEDQVSTPTFTNDLAKRLGELLESGVYGLYHVTNSGQCSWHEFAAKIFARLGLRPSLSPTTSKDFNAKAKRPVYSVLARDKLRRLAIEDMPPWQDALDRYLIDKGYLRSSAKIPPTSA